MQQREFLVGQGDDLLLARDPTAQQIQLQVGQVEMVGLAHHPATQDGADAQEQFGEGKRFDQVIVGA